MQTGHLDLSKFDEDRLESSLAFVFGIDVPSRTLQEVPKKIQCLQIYYAAPVVEDLPPGVFGSTVTPDQSVWTELPLPLKKGVVREWQHTDLPAASAAAAAWARPPKQTTSSKDYDKDCVPSPEAGAGEP